jgi:Glycosyltransferase Family 4
MSRSAGIAATSPIGRLTDGASRSSAQPQPLRLLEELIEELIELDHEVTLFASGDSVTSATLVPGWPRALRLGRPKSDPAVAQTALLEIVAQHAQRFDVIHCHTDWTHLPLVTRLGVPFLTTLHNPLDTPGLPDTVRHFPVAPFISISDNQRKPLSGAIAGRGSFPGTVTNR